MNLLHYFERYPLCKKELTALEGRLSLLPCAGEERSRLERRLDETRAEMDEIRQTLARLYAESPGGGLRERYKRSDEKHFLECRYLQGLTVEKTAEVLCVSRDTAFRIRRRLAAKELDQTLLQKRLFSDEPLPAAGQPTPAETGDEPKISNAAEKTRKASVSDASRDSGLRNAAPSLFAAGETLAKSA